MFSFGFLVMSALQKASCMRVAAWPCPRGLRDNSVRAEQRPLLGVRPLLCASPASPRDTAALKPNQPSPMTSQGCSFQIQDARNHVSQAIYLLANRDENYQFKTGAEVLKVSCPDLARLLESTGPRTLREPCAQGPRPTSSGVAED